MVYFQSFTQEEWAEYLVSFSEAGLDEAKAKKRARYRAKQIMHWVYQRHVADWEAMTDLSKDLRRALKSKVEIPRLAPRDEREAQDGTVKFLWALHDGKTVESVVIPMENRLTACISSQVGCAMGCRFCLTGIQGIDRNLETHEIVMQVLELRMRFPITNIVFMGMGEPLHNLKNVMQACRILLDDDGLRFSKRKVTVSTSGIVPAIEELGKTIDVSLAVSLNAATDEKRSAIMPVNRKWNIEALLQACRNYPLGSHRRITFEYVLIKDFNDGLEDAMALEKLVRNLPCKINLIPLNEHPGAPFKSPTSARVEQFQKVLLDKGLTATLRHSRGQDILAACGQLRSLAGTARGSERHRDWKVLPVLPGN